MSAPRSLTMIQRTRAGRGRPVKR